MDFLGQLQADASRSVFHVPWGTGDTPIREVLQLLQRERWPIRAHLEYEYMGSGSPVDEVTRCFDYVKQVLL